MVICQIMVYNEIIPKKRGVNMGNDISGLKLLKILIFKFFTSEIIGAIINIFIPVVISIRCTNFTDDKNWWLVTFVMCSVIVGFNIASAIVRKIQSNSERYLNLIFRCYSDCGSINSRSATNIFRLNKIIGQHIADNKPVNKRVFDKIADFQTFAFTICESIQNMIRNEYGDDIKCEVTLMKKDGNNVKMIAYANNEREMPASYTQTYNLSEINYFFASLFNDLNGKISCLPNKKRVKECFKEIPGSEKRESEVCQYIGIPIRTNRNQIELLLQIDVSKEKVFGKGETNVLVFAKNVIYPYATLLHKSYERDLIFNQYYDMITSVLSRKR